MTIVEPERHRARERPRARHLAVQHAPDTGAGTAPPAPAERAPTRRPVLVDDGVEPAPDQMSRSEFLAIGIERVRRAADRELAEVGRSAEQCPYLDHWVARFSAKSTEGLEHAVVLYARPSVLTAGGLLAALEGRVSAGVRQWKAGQPVGLPDAPGEGVTSSLLGAVLQRRAEGPTEATFGERGRAAAIQGRLGPGRPLDGPVRSRMESALGGSFTGVRVHTTPAAHAVAAEEGARALTVGADVVFAPNRFQPGTPSGDILLAHELAHARQQQRGSPGARSYGALEGEADAVALAAVTGSKAPPVRAGGALGLQACKSCLPDSEPPSLLDRLKDVSDAQTLSDELAGARDADVKELADRAPPGSTLATAVQWELAFRSRSWKTLSPLTRRSGDRGLHEPYSVRLVELIAAGSTTITLDAADRDFAAWARGQLEELSRYPTGFRLLVELLATGQTVHLRKQAGENRRLPPAGVATEAGTLKVLEGNRMLPREKQVRSAPVGSIIELDPSAMENMAFPGGEPGKYRPVEADAAVTLGHELIHALHHARGEAVPNPGGALIPFVGTVNPVTGGIESVGELYTITGGREYDVAETRTSFNVSTDISENTLRAERGLPPRLSHEGVTRQVPVPLTGTETLDQLVARYRTVDGTAVPPAVKAAVRRVILTWYTVDNFPTKHPIPALPLPTAQYVALHLLLVERNVPLSQQVDELEGP